MVMVSPLAANTGGMTAGGMTATVDDAIYAGSVTTLLVKTRGPALRVRLATPGGRLVILEFARYRRIAAVVFQARDAASHGVMGFATRSRSGRKAPFEVASCARRLSHRGTPTHIGRTGAPSQISGGATAAMRRCWPM